MHIPVPLHERAAVSADPVHVWEAQVVPVPYRRQPPAPLQKPSVPQLDAPWSVHWFSGSRPVGTLVHVPRLPASAHDWQVPAQALAQQTPCSHRLVAQSLGAVQVMPVGRFVQAPITQTLGAVQSPSAAHDVLQTFVAQA